MLNITTYQGEIVARRFVSVHELAIPIDVRLPGASPARPAGATVSISELRRPPARKAVEAAAAAGRLSTSGRFDEAAGELEKAVRISPDFAAAHANLGVQYLRLQRFDEARVQIERALEIAGPNARDLSNLAFALTALQRLPEAAAAARKALALDRDNAPAHYLLGRILAASPETRGEGIAHLEEAAPTLVSARQALDALQR